MKSIIIICTILISVLFISSCCEKSTGPDEDTHHIGWIVGSPDNGYGAIFKTTDSGQTWIRQGDTLTVPNITLNSVRAVDSLTAWSAGLQSGGWATILKTADGGLNWQRIGNRGDLPDKEILCLHVCSNDEVWAVGFGNTVLYTNDGGTNWISKAPTDTTYINWKYSSIAIVGEKVWLTGGTGVQPESGIILHSSDYGDTWSIQSHGDYLIKRELIEISAASDSCLWVVGHGRSILHTTTGGVVWEIQKGDIEANWDANGVTAISNNEAWVVEDLGYIYHTDDGGDIWVRQTSVPNSTNSYFLYRISPISSKIVWVIGPCATPPFDGIILYTVDGGNSWTRQNYSPAVFLSDVSFVGSYH